MPTSDPAHLRIGEVSRRTGVPVATLRAWERRYELLRPTRTTGGHRLYRDGDVARVEAMRALVADGWLAAAAARQVARDVRTAPGGGEDGDGDLGPVSLLVGRLVAAIEAYDAAAVHAVIDEALTRFDVPTALDLVVVPVLREAGDGWAQDAGVVAREHFTSHAVRPRLLELLRAPSAGPETVLAATPADEDHDLGLLAACATAAWAGWRVHFLGARTPAEALGRAARRLQPTVVLVAAVLREHGEHFAAAPPDLGEIPLVLGGAGFHAQDVAALPNARLHHGGYRDLPALLLAVRDRSGASTGADVSE